MHPFKYLRVTSVGEAAEAAVLPGATVLAGGTTLVDLMRLEVVAPRLLVDLNGLDALRTVAVTGQGILIGALATMATVAAHPEIKRNYPALAESLRLAASQQLRNVATIGGNVLQRTRCSYFRDGISPCNKRRPGSGCAALLGYNRDHAILGGSSECIAVYPGDWATALAAFDASVEVTSREGPRAIKLCALHRDPGARPDMETVLRPGDIVTAIFVPHTSMGRSSTYLKVRARQSFAFAIASAAVALEMRDGIVVDARIALGGVATRPWRSQLAEAAIVGRRMTAENAGLAGQAAFSGARAARDNRVKLDLGPRVVAQALMTAGAKEGAP